MGTGGRIHGEFFLKPAGWRTSWLAQSEQFWVHPPDSPDLQATTSDPERKVMPTDSRREHTLIDLFLSCYGNDSWANCELDWLEKRKDGAVEVLATRSDGKTLAIEHTLIQPFARDKEDFAYFRKSFGCGSFRTGGSGAVERKMDLSYYGSSEGILGLGSWVGQNNLTRKTERLDCWDLLT